MTRFDRDIIEGMFQHIRDRTEWPIDAGACLWRYFFIDRDRQKLDAAGRLLEKVGYQYEATWEPDDEIEEEASNPIFYLVVRMIEHHTVDTLMARNEQLSDFARTHGLESYDGMDVGAVPDSAASKKQ
jgi:hypothetical protein